MSESTATPAQPTGAPQAATDYPFLFTGKGTEYFRIWIVNIALTLVTLGIYSAWAKVRNNRYIYGNTSVAGGNFDYHADPKVILRGRIIAVLILLLYLGASSFLPLIGAVMAIAVFFAIPWIVVRSLAFNARMSSWRNIRFSFVGKTMGAAGAYIGWPIVGVLTLGIGMPFAWFKTAQFGVNNHRLGQTPFKLNARPVDFYIILGYMALAGLAAALVAGVFGFSAISSVGDDPEQLNAGQIVAFAMIGVIYLLIFNLFSALRFKAVYDKLDLGSNRVHNSMSVLGYLTVAVTNTIAMLFTLGLFYPWAKVRMSKFLVESLTLEAVDLDGFVASAEEEQSAFGEELGDAFDLGIGV